MKYLRPALALATACCCTWGVAGAGAIAPARMVILGVDGMDPKVLAEFMRQGLTPNLSRLAATGGFVSLGTSIPPQSPVAWSTFITGLDPGGHGIFDFLHLDRDTLTPYMSTSRVSGTAVTLPLGRWRIPLVGQETQLLRHGAAFWELLEQHGVHTRMFQIPANYPPVETSGSAFREWERLICRARRAYSRSTRTIRVGAAKPSQAGPSRTSRCRTAWCGAMSTVRRTRC